MLRLTLVIIISVFGMLSYGTVFAQETTNKSLVSKSRWNFGCGTAASGKNICQVQRNITVGEDNNIVMQVLITKERGNPQQLIRFVTPLDVDIPHGVTYAVARQGKAGSGRRAAYKSCTNTGCTTLGVFDANQVEEFKKGSKIDAVFLYADHRKIGISIDLTGFTIVHDQLIQNTK